MHRLIRNLEKFIRDHELIVPGSLVLAAFSGGSDSTALVHGLYALQDSLRFQLAVCHVNHLLRGAESERDQAFVKHWAEERKISCYLSQHDVRAYQRSARLSLEEAARIIRYQCFDTIADSIGAGAIALGHHFGDQTETVLMHILRGCGLRGLVGMKPRSGRYIRPFIEFRKQDIADFLYDETIPYIEDSTNQDPRFLRNRIRCQLLPLLEKDYNPRIRESLNRLSRNASEHIEKTRNPSRPIWKKSGLAAYPLFRLIDLELPELKQELFWFLSQIRGRTTELSRDHLESLAEMVKSGKGKMNLPDKVTVWIESQHLFGSQNPVLTTRTPAWKYVVTCPGTNSMPDLGIALDCEIDPDLSLPLKGDWVVTIDRQLVSFPFILRNYQPGDRVYSGGKDRKLKDVFSRYHLPEEWRRRVPVLCDREKILWIPGVVLDERVQVGENSKSLVRIRMRKIAG